MQCAVQCCCEPIDKQKYVGKVDAPFQDTTITEQHVLCRPTPARLQATHCAASMTCVPAVFFIFEAAHHQPMQDVCLAGKQQGPSRIMQKLSRSHCPAAMVPNMIG